MHIWPVIHHDTGAHGLLLAIHAAINCRYGPVPSVLYGVLFNSTRTLTKEG